MIIKKYILVPFFLNFLGFIINDTCGDIICLFPGRGFPLGYYYNNIFSFKFFFIDLIFIIIIYFLVIKLIEFINKKIKK